MDQPAYWTAPSWPVVVTLITAVGAAAASFFQYWWRHRDDKTGTEAQKREGEAARLERIANEQYERVERRALRAEERSDELSKRIEDLEAECDKTRDEARGMEDWAHFFRHGWANKLQRYMMLLRMMRSIISRVTSSIVVAEAEIEADPSRDWADRRRNIAAIRCALEPANAFLEEVVARPPFIPPKVPLMRRANVDQPPREQYDLRPGRQAS